MQLNSCCCSHTVFLIEMNSTADRALSVPEGLETYVLYSMLIITHIDYYLPSKPLQTLMLFI